MTVKRLCEGECGTEIVGRADKRVCSDTCRQRVRRRQEQEARKTHAAGPVQSAIADAVRKELQALGVLELGAAQIALGIAEQLDSRELLGAAYVSLSKELDRRMDALRLSVPRPGDPGDVIRQRVEAKRALLRVVEP